MINVHPRGERDPENEPDEGEIGSFSMVNGETVFYEVGDNLDRWISTDEALTIGEMR